MYILGIGDHMHDASVCLMKDGNVVAAIETERLSRIKHSVKVNIDHYRIDQMGHYFSDLMNQHTIADREKTYQRCIDYCVDMLDDANFEKIDMTVLACLYKEPVFKHQSVVMNHHLAHAASTFYPSPFQEAAILTLDGYGNGYENSYETAMFATGEGNRIISIDSLTGEFKLTDQERTQGLQDTLIVLENSIGAFYKNITILIGMGHFGEGKTMGLAAYGEDQPEFNTIRQYISFLANGRLHIDNRSIFEYCSRVVDRARKTLPHDKLFKYFADLAYKAQQLTEEMIIHCCNHLYKITKKKSLCLAGGVALNSTTNGKLTEKTPFERIFVQPAAGDNGISLGCAYYGYYTLLNNKRHPTSYFSPYLGKIYSSAEINSVAKNNEAIELYSSPLPAYELAAQLISEGKIIGWFNNRSEIGPRALGNRSILADPRCSKMKDILNLQIKKRESFRPFAPAILEEEAKNYFELTDPVPYMLAICKVKSEAQSLIPAAMHVDGSARVQTVSKNQNPSFYNLISAFKERTGIPIILNTSFNGNGEPIVETPEDAIQCFLNIGLDALFLNGICYVNPLKFDPSQKRQTYHE